MSFLLNIDFGGYVQINWGSLETAIQNYATIATDNGLIKKGFNLEFSGNPDDPTLHGITFFYHKADLPEAQLQVFNDTWLSIAEQYNIVRGQTNITYREV